MSRKNSPQLTFRADTDLREALQLAAKQDGRSVSNYCQVVLADELYRRGLLPRPTVVIGRSITEN